MKKLLMFCVLSCSTLLAVENQFYIGAGINKGSGIRDYYRTSDNVLVGSVDFDESGKYFKIGYITKSKNRIELFYSSEKLTNSNNSSDSDTDTGIGVNGIITFTNLSNKIFLPYFTGGIGIYKSKAYDKKGTGLNIGLGTYITLTENIELDISYKGNVVRIDDSDYYLEDSYTTFNAGLNYKF